MKKIKFSFKSLIKIIFVCFLWFLLYDMIFNYVDWRTADRSSAELAPAPAAHKEAVVQVYAARTYNWRRFLAVHSWISTKDKNADSYLTYQVAGFYLWRTGSSVQVIEDIPDRHWYGEKPMLLADLRGRAAEKAIPEIKAAAKSYPYSHTYTAWPGPNSNTFVSYIIRQVPELEMSLPSNAIGKDFLGFKTFVAESESKTGWQFSVLGLFGITVGIVEGIEINILGLNFGIDFLKPAVKLPFVGRIGFNRLKEIKHEN